MGRPRARELTERELQVMHAFWGREDTGAPATVAEVRDALAASGLELAYTTVATLVRILAGKGFLVQTNAERPFTYRPARSYEEVSRRLLDDVLDRVFGGSRERLLVRLMERARLTDRERDLLRGLLEDTGGPLPGTDGRGKRGRIP
jgi:predicted transcriptional regulator